MIYLRNESGELVEEFQTTKQVKEKYDDWRDRLGNSYSSLKLTYDNTLKVYLYKYLVSPQGFIKNFQDALSPDGWGTYETETYLVLYSDDTPNYKVVGGQLLDTTPDDFKVNPDYEKTFEDKMNDIRGERNQRLISTDVDWIVELGKKTLGESNTWDVVEAKKRTLRDFPATITLDNVDSPDWPV